MRKRELVHLHVLGATLRREVDPPSDITADYDEIDVAPTGIHDSKANHRRAVLALFDALGNTCRHRSVATDSLTKGHSRP
ncbi:MAG: UPF0058 family protein [Salinirussus sp.]